MDRLNRIRGEAEDPRDATIDSSSHFMSANESSSKYYSLSEVDSTFSISPSKDTIPDVHDTTISGGSDIISLSPIPKSDADTFKIGKHIEAANILSGGVNIFDDNENSYDGDELVIDDNVAPEEEKTNDLKSMEGTMPLDKTDETTETADEAEAIPSKDSEVVLQIDGKNVDAIDIGNDLYLYRRAGEEELAAVQIINDDQQQPSFKFLKVRENTEGNLEVYEEIEVEIPKEVPTKTVSSNEKTAHVPIKDISKVINEPCNKVIDKVSKTPKNGSSLTCTLPSETGIDLQSESKTEVNLNGKMMKFSESRKSPLIGTFTPMTFTSTPNKEGIPLTKTMVNQQLHPSRHSDNIKKTIEVHTDNNKPKLIESSTRPKDLTDATKIIDVDLAKEKDECKNVITKPSQQENEIENKGLHQEILNISSVPLKDTKANTNQKELGTLEESKSTSQKNASDLELSNDSSNMKIKNTCSENTFTSEGEQSMVNKELEQYHIPQEDKVRKEETINTNETKIVRTDASNKNTDDVFENADKTIALSNRKTLEKEKDNSLNIFIGKNEVALNKTDTMNEVPQVLTDTQHNAAQVINVINDEISIPKQLKSPLSSEVEIATHTSIGIHKDIHETENKDFEKNRIIEIEPTKPTSETNAGNNVAVEDKRNNVAIDDKRDLTFNKDENVDIICKTNKEKTIFDNFKNENSKVEINSKFSDPKLPVTDIENVKHDVTNEKSLSEAVKTIAESPPQQILEKNIDKTNVGVTKSDIETPATATKFSNDKKTETGQDVAKAKIMLPKPNVCNSAVPFGKWTEANRQEFLNKIKESKVQSNNPNTNQIKQTNDLNRRDVLKKFDSQRQSNITAPAKIPDFGSAPKFSSKMDTAAFVNKAAVTQNANPVEHVGSSLKTNTEQVNEVHEKVSNEEELESDAEVQRKIINSQELIDRTIEGIITRAIKIKTIPDHMKEQKTIHTVENRKDGMPLPGSLDDIEMKMNELHGISYADRPVGEPVHSYQDSKSNTNNKNNKMPNLLPFKTKDEQKSVKDSGRDETSDEEIIEHEPITGDIDDGKQNLITLLSSKEKTLKEIKKDGIITEKDFDKFARRNSKTYENCLTVKFDSKEQHNVIQTVVEKDTSLKKLSRNELLLAESKAKSFTKQNNAARHSKIPTLKTFTEEDCHKSYQSKVQIAYHSALTAKRNLECPITIIEDKPVKVVYMDTNTEYSPALLNVQGQELSPSKKKSDSDVLIHSASESLDSDTMDSGQDMKYQDEIKSKGKHQRKQVLTPVEEDLELQLIEPADLGIKVSPTKKRRLEEKVNKSTKNLVPKKSYLLNRSVVEDNAKSKLDQQKNIFKEAEVRNENTFMGHTDTITAIDNLVKAAELIETQSENNTHTMVTNDTTIPQNTPIKRGRGRPRKYPLPAAESDNNKSLSPVKRPRLIDSKASTSYTDSDESIDGEIVKENWTMGKINENIVCPICNKLFRSENVVFKHVKHCTGPSPSRSDSDKRSPQRVRNSQESDTKSRDSTTDDSESDDEVIIKNRKSNENVAKLDKEIDIIVIEDTPIKEKTSNPQNQTNKNNLQDTKKVLRNTKFQPNTHNLKCEYCGKTFRQLSYLVNHKLQHKNEGGKTLESEHDTNKSVFSCEVCKKEFRKLHHLVQHRIIHNPSMMQRTHRKSSSEQRETKNLKSHNDDTSAGFRCEPCDKSFRKLHHLVEHRETHDGINKKVNTSSNAAQGATESSKSLLAHHCDTCKMVFKKLEDLLEHKEQHYDTSSEKSDDKSVKSSLSTKDIIHECSLCYMVFPNEHSLNKHTIICLRKKKQSAAKQAAKATEGNEPINEDIAECDENTSQDVESVKSNQFEDVEIVEKPLEIPEIDVQVCEKIKDVKVKDDEELCKEQSEGTKSNLDVNTDLNLPKKRRSSANDKIISIDDIDTPPKLKKTDENEVKSSVDTPKPKKKLNKEKIHPVTKRYKSMNVPLLAISDPKPSAVSSDDDDVRYMLNPNFVDEDSAARKVYMKIRAFKRNSLQIERPNSKDLAKRRISLQHPPKMPRLKAKPIEANIIKESVAEEKLQTSKAKEAATDSDDSDIKYSLPESKESKQIPKIVKRRSSKRKSLPGIAKRKSLGKATTNTKPKRRTAEVEHRCDCGQLFSSAALLSRHTTLAHTPPRIRRRRSPPPDTKPQPNTKQTTKPQIPKPQNTKPATTKPQITKPQTAKSTNTKQPTAKPPTPKSQKTKPVTKPNIQQKKPKPNVTKSNKTIKVGVATRKSSVNIDALPTNDNGKTVKGESNFKSLRSASRGVAMDKMRKTLEKPKK